MQNFVFILKDLIKSKFAYFSRQERQYSGIILGFVVHAMASISVQLLHSALDGVHAGH